MRAFLGIGRPLRVALAGIAALALTGDLAAAAERLVMSYDCRVDGRDLALVPSAPREYPILGNRDHQIHTACSPSDPGRCRSWRVHRFDIDCGGARVSWLDVVGAVAYQKRYPARVGGDRMVIGMGRSWGEADRVPNAGYVRRYPGANGDRFATPRTAPGRLIELPPGFAPTLGIDAQFVEAPPPVAAKQAAPMDAATIAPPLPNPARKESSGAATSTAAASRSEVVAGAAKAAEAKADVKADTRAAPPAPSGGDQPSPGYKILNPGGETDASASKHLRQPIAPASPPASAPAAQSSRAPETASTPSPAGTGDSKDKLAMLPAAPSPAAAPTLPSPAEPATVAATPQSRRFTTIAGAAIAAAALAAIALAAFMVSRPRAPRGHPVPPEARDYAAISLGGDTGTRALVPAPPGANEPRLLMSPPAPSQPASDPQARAHAANAAPPPPEAEGVLDWLPETRAEALALLGAAPDAPVEVVKRIADGLRQSWHPDLAANELDRIVREKRTKQLNVAWDLIAARSQAA